MRIKKIMMMSIFVSVAIILSYVERLIPTPYLVAGAKLGLANIVTVMSLKMMDKKSAFVILMLRIVLVTFMFGGFSSFLYSLSGGFLSYMGMSIMLMIDFKEVSLVGVSVIGATLHSIGQITVAAILFSNMLLLSYLPMLLLTSTVTGIFIGLVANNLVKHMKHAKIS